MADVTTLTQFKPAAWLRAVRACNDPAVLVFVVSAKGSAPRDTDAWMLVTKSDVQGTIGGGNLEYQAIEAARALTGTERRLDTKLLGPDLAQCCGGAVELLFQPVVSAWFDTATLAGQKKMAFPLDDMSAPPTVEPGPGRYFAVSLLTEFDKAVIFGAGHVGLECAQLLARLPFDVTVIDPRADRRRKVGDNITALPSAPNLTDAVVLVMTHDHQLDYEICLKALRDSNFRWLGLIGSKTKAARFRKRLREDGIADNSLARLVSPIGDPNIPGKQPAVIAVAVAAQLLAEQAATQNLETQRHDRQN